MDQPPYTLDELRDFIARRSLLAEGLVERETAVRWWSLGWIRQKKLGTDVWEITPEGQQKLDAPPTKW